MKLVRTPSVLLASLLVLAVAAPAPALAGHKTRSHRFYAVETGSSQLKLAGPGLFKATSEAAMHGKLIGDATLDLKFSLKVVAGGGPLQGDGKFKITAQDGSTLRGTMTGSVTLAGAVNSAEWVSRVTGGTGRFAGASGWLVSRGTATIASVDPTTGAITTTDQATCEGKIRYGKRGRRGRH